MILINFASRSRPQRFHACMTNISECFTDYKVLVKIDTDDPSFKDYTSIPYPEAIQVFGRSASKVHAINRGINDKDFDILVNTSDDILWKPGAGDEILKNIEKDTFLHFPEVYADSQAKLKGDRPTVSVVSIMDKIYYDRFKYVYHPSYHSLWCDNEATEVSRKLGKYKFVDKHIFQHIHPAAGLVKKDQQYRITESFYQIDKQTYKARNLNNFDV